MRPRAYAVALVVLASALLLATIAANVLIDPQDVFATGLLRAHFNANHRYQAFRAYAASPERYDGVLFASSRGNAFDRGLLARRLGVGAVANFSVPFGLLTDHLPVLDYLVRDKARRGERLAAVFLVLDADFFGKQPWTNVNIDSFQPPAISGENPVKFWWRNLTAFQWKHWRQDLGPRRSAAAMQRRALHRAFAAAFLPSPRLAAIASDMGNAVKASREELAAPEVRSDLARQLALLRRFVALCREQHIRLAVAFSPLNRANVDDAHAPDAERIVDEVARITPVVDFDRPQWLSARSDLWSDLSHYSPRVATMMIERIFAGAAPGAPPDFGERKGP